MPFCIPVQNAEDNDTPAFNSIDHKVCMENVNSNRRRSFGSFAAGHWICGNVFQGIVEIVKVRLGLLPPERSEAQLVDVPDVLICVCVSLNCIRSPGRLVPGGLKQFFSRQRADATCYSLVNHLLDVRDLFLPHLLAPDQVTDEITAVAAFPVFALRLDPSLHLLRKRNFHRCHFGISLVRKLQLWQTLS
jgi:hypothetical protein